MTASTSVLPLDHEAVISALGPDASKFLQGQLTCNLNYLDEAHASLGARCTPKGRMVSSFRIVSYSDGVLLALDKALLDKQLTDLKKFAVFSKATLSDASAQWLRFGLLLGDDAPQGLPTEVNTVVRHEHALAIALPGNRVELWLHHEGHSPWHELVQQRPKAALNDWLLAQVRAGVGQVFAASSELFIPQMINLQALGGVSFKKGCYTGQEIVARMQYRGHLKRRLYRLSAAAVPCPVATPLYSPVHGSSVGEVVLAAATTEGCELLAVVQEDAIADGRIYLDAEQQQALTLLDLPYQPDADQDILR